MNASGLFKQMRTPADNGLLIRLKTLTPLYTGGIGQEGDQVHPSNLLGGVRNFSCLVARTLGDSAFEGKVWGNAGGGGTTAQGKQVGLHWDLSRLTSHELPGEIKIPKNGNDHSKWWFNTGFEGEIDLTLTRRGISDAHWQILQLALAIQVRHATFGAKDQFGLGVLGWRGNPPVLGPLNAAARWPAALTDESIGRLNLHRYGFFKVRLSPAPGRPPAFNRTIALTIALTARSAMRNALRADAKAADSDKERLTNLRHRMLGKLNKHGSATNVSGAYPVGDGKVESRVAVALKPEDKTVRTDVMKRFKDALGNADFAPTGYKMPQVSYEFGGAQGRDKIAAWLNKLAGV